MLCDPGHVGLDARVDPGNVTQGAAVAPADHSHQVPGTFLLADQRAARVTLRRERGTEHGWWAAKAGSGQRQDGTHVAGVPALGPGAQHVIPDDLLVVIVVPGGSVVILVTGLVLHHLHGHLLQAVGRRQ